MKTINRNGLNANRSESIYTNIMMFTEIGSREKNSGTWSEQKKNLLAEFRDKLYCIFHRISATEWYSITVIAINFQFVVYFAFSVILKISFTFAFQYRRK